MSKVTETSAPADLPPLPPSPPYETHITDNPTQYPSGDVLQVTEEDVQTSKDNTLHVPPLYILPQVHIEPSSRLHGRLRHQNQSPHPRYCNTGSPPKDQKSMASHPQAADFYAPSVQKQIRSSGRFPVRPMSRSTPPQQRPTAPVRAKFVERFDDDVALYPTTTTPASAAAKNGTTGSDDDDHSSRPATKASSHPASSSTSSKQSKMSPVRSLRTFGGDYQKRDFQLYDPEATPRLLSRGWSSSGPGEQHTRKARIVFMAVAVVGMTGLVLVGLACSRVL